MADIQLAFRVPDETGQWLDDRAARYASGSRYMQARNDLQLLRHLLAAEARRLHMSLAEAQCLASVMGGTMIDNTIGQLLYAETADAFQLARRADPTGGDVSSYAAQFGIDEDHLLKRLAELGPVGDFAVRDALSQWWQRGSESSEADSFRAVGLTIIGS